MRNHMVGAGALIAVLAAPGVAAAQVVGTFPWQLQPFCNVVTLTVTQQGTTFLLDGTDNRCGSGAGPVGVRGIAFPKPNGAIGFGLTLVGTPGAVPVAIEAEVSSTTLSGTWTDSGGHSGTMAYNGSVSGSPVPRAGLGTAAIADGGITAAKLAGGSVTTGAVADGSITAAKLAPGVGGTGDITSVVAGSGLVGGATSGDATLAVSFAGTGSAATAARSDHTHAAVAAVLECSSTTVSQSVSANAVFDIEIPACASGYTVTGAGCRTPGFNQANWAINGLSRVGSSLITFCSGTNITAGTITVEGAAQCCRVGVAP